jgi:hypothetical protein
MTITRRVVRPPKSMTAHVSIRVEAEPGQPFPVAELREAWAMMGGNYTIEAQVAYAERSALAVLADKGIEAGRIRESDGRYTEPWHRAAVETIEWHAARLLKSIRDYRHFKVENDAGAAELAAYEVGYGAATTALKAQWEEYAIPGHRSVEGWRDEIKRRKAKTATSYAAVAKLAADYWRRHPKATDSEVARWIENNGTPGRSNRTLRRAVAEARKKLAITRA